MYCYLPKRATKTSNDSFLSEYNTNSSLLKPSSTYHIHITNKAVESINIETGNK